MSGRTVALMNILVINCGSSSLKYQLIKSDSEEVVAKGICDRINIDGFISHQTIGSDKVKKDISLPDHTVAIKEVLKALMENGAISSLSDIDAVGHRIVHGGEYFSEAVLITEEMLDIVKECNDLAPLHNPANITGIRACQVAIPNVPMVAVFDTAFHQTLPEKAYFYGLPYRYYEDYKIRRYGFHGTSHDYVSKKAAQLAGVDIDNSKIIVCHLGNGASITAVKDGKSIDTSMGLTPLEGVVMGTRSGDIDPAIVEFIMNKEGIEVEETINILNKKSGMLGLSNLSSDFRDLQDARNDGNEMAIRALEVYAYKIAKYIGSYVMAMGGVDIIAFTAGIGENDEDVRRDICEYLVPFGAKINYEYNKGRGQEGMLSLPDSSIKIMIVPTNEELAIARETLRIIEK